MFLGYAHGAPGFQTGEFEELDGAGCRRVVLKLRALKGPGSV